MHGTSIKTAFVSTNSISQGEQVGVLWNAIFGKYGAKIHFAHQTFSWANEAKGNAAVHVVIIGFACFDTTSKVLYEYPDIKGEPHAIQVKNINPFLVEAGNTLLQNLKKPVCNVPNISFGNMPNDGGNLLLSDSEKIELLNLNPELERFILPFISANEFLNGHKRWCFWLLNVAPQEIKNSKVLLNRVSEVQKYRLLSTREATRKLASSSSLFGEIRQPNSSYVLIPLHSSENRVYIPMGYFNSENIANNSCSIIPNATNFHFGILTSLMHMAWVKFTCGRIKSDYRYSNSIVYNNYPWPENPSDKQKEAVETAAQQVLDVRLKYQETGSSLADLYDPLTMPPDLVKAHQLLDKAVDGCYSKATFASDSKRMEFLFELYEKYTAGLFVKEKKRKKKG
jgi:hypothetical protein